MKLIKTIIAVVAALFSGNWCEYGCAAEQEYTFDQLLDAIAEVESSWNPSAVGDNGGAIGLYQIHQIYVDDVNNIFAEHGWKSRFSYNDRWDMDLSREMVAIYLQHYGKGKTIEQMARIHNGGPDGWKKKSTEKYWLKVKKVLEVRTEK